MNSIDALNSSLYFSSIANANKNKKSEKLKNESTKKTSFKSIFEKNVETQELISSGLPVELAGLSIEESLVFLKDNVDSAADKLSQDFNNESFANFKKSVGQFVKFVVSKNFEIEKIKRRGFTTKKSVYHTEVKPREPHVQVKIIDNKINELAIMVLNNHKDKLKLLERVGEIKGLVLEFLFV